ncbi:MAG: T9SS type A sorting domain-containing protein [Actinobacteria bacterium]|nr:T9SS type A sorting domain-containing protein [Actinomycetota bacterium]
MTKRILLLLFVSTCLMLASAKATTIILPERQGPPGSLVQVPVIVDSAETVAGCEFILQYDKSFLEFVRLDSIGLADGFTFAVKTKDDSIAISMARAVGIQKSYVTLLGLTFRIRNSAQVGAATEITWIQSRLYSESTSLIDHSVKHGVVRVSAISVFPNPFTPNEDGINDTANFIVPDSLSFDAAVKIFSVSGQLVKELFNNESTYMKWNGKDKDDNPVKPGVYIYLILANGTALSKGTITLMR